MACVVYVLSGMASVDSSAPETTSSDNSPTLVRRSFTGSSGGTAAVGHHGGPGSDSGSSHSDSVESSSSGCKPVTQQAQQMRGALKAQHSDADKYARCYFYASSGHFVGHDSMLSAFPFVSAYMCASMLATGEAFPSGLSSTYNSYI